MTGIIDKPIRAGELPPGMRGDLDPSSLILVTIRQITANGFIDAEETAILAAESQVVDVPFRPAREVLAEIRAALAQATRGFKPPPEARRICVHPRASVSYLRLNSFFAALVRTPRRPPNTGARLVCDGVHTMLSSRHRTRPICP